MSDRFWPAFKESILEFIYGPTFLTHIREQEKQLKLAEETFEKYRKFALMSDPTNNTLLARIKELEEALKPFAEMADSFDYEGRELKDTDGIYAFTAGDFRLARKVLRK